MDDFARARAKSWLAVRKMPRIGEQKIQDPATCVKGAYAPRPESSRTISVCASPLGGRRACTAAARAETAAPLAGYRPTRLTPRRGSALRPGGRLLVEDDALRTAHRHEAVLPGRRRGVGPAEQRDGHREAHGGGHGGGWKPAPDLPNMGRPTQWFRPQFTRWPTQFYYPAR